MTGEEIGLFAERYLQGEGETREAEESGPWADIHCCEFIAAGLQEYF
jgi:hypothetical protein